MGVDTTDFPIMPDKKVFESHLGDLEFKAEDFEGKVLDLDADGDRKFLLMRRDAECIAYFANCILKEKLEKAILIPFHFELARSNAVSAGLEDSLPHTHTARLVCIEEIKK